MRRLDCSAVGTNLGQSGPPPTTATTVQTSRATGGSPGSSTNVNHTVHGAGGVALQVGWTIASGGA